MSATTFGRLAQPSAHPAEVDDRTLRDIGLTRLDLWAVVEDPSTIYPILGLSLGTGGFVAATLAVVSVFI